jgi:drug/metabolite transporter (DMT)-like permease
MVNDKLKGGIFVFLGACSFGLLSTIVKTAYSEGYTLGQVTGSQTFFGMSLLWIIYLIQYSYGKSKKPDKKAEKEAGTKTTKWWKVALAGTFTGLVGIFYYQSVKLLPASIAIILLMQYLWISILIEAVVFKKKPHKMQLIAAAIVLVGTLFAGGVFNHEVVLNAKGIFFGFLAAICYSVFILTSGRIGNDLPVFKKSALMITGSCLITWIIFPPLFFFDGVFFDGLYKWGLSLALLGTVIPPLFFSIGMPRTGVSLGAILSAAELPVAVTSSRFILHENVQLLQWLGVALILFAIIMTNLKLKKKV